MTNRIKGVSMKRRRIRKRRKGMADRELIGRMKTSKSNRKVGSQDEGKEKKEVSEGAVHGTSTHITDLDAH